MRAALLLTAFTLAATFFQPVSAWAEEGKQEEAPAMQAAKPGPEHALLAQQAGKWKATQKMMMDPSQPPVVTESTEVCELICNGLFLRSDYMAKDSTGEFHGSGLLGYDTAKQKYVGVWVDTFATAMYPYEGTCTGNKCTYTMQTTDPGGKPVTLTLVYEMIDDNHRKFAMMMPGPDGKPMTTMEIDYTRM
jgi:hypothetical protein